ncbi:hypothetical protein DEU56DRAFT_779824 [Suillus clintonianus]|uniref:uncharacterized protein n=1 Tax=Suillus clintonianus TaxID=1904413 RepID=UPI001B8805C3|nr:uncharacterized protein DEU56DRAFT_779824 [Suillus clintonianus]KAG2150417.1 hypothetical protein DEU56DRAFT_779824 [Suillus clintonianus]
MDTPSSNSLLKPRLRLIRRTPSPRAQDSSDMDFTPVAVPSSARSQFNVVDDEDDNQPTPRMPLKNIASSSNSYGTDSEFGPSTSYAIPSDTPAARLRALLARSSDSPSGKSPPTRLYAQPSEDGAGSVSSSRFTRDSLKDLFSHARREPGDTPQKSRPRRNSFDTSEMDITPVVDRERDKHKGKRKSLSDDEVDKPKSSKGSESSSRSSHAATFDTLRARLMSSHSQLLDQKLPTAIYDVTSQPSEIGSLLSDEHRLERHANVNPTTTLLRPLDSSWSSPPRSAGSPHGTFQLPSQLVSHSNLLDQDSDMQHAMRDLDTSEDAPGPTPGPSTGRPSTTPLRPRSSLSYRGSLRHHDQSRRASLELPGPRASSSLSEADFKEKQHSREEDQMHQREREWNRPKAPSRSVTPELHHRHSLEFHRRHSQEIPRTSPSHVKSLSNGATISRSGSPLSSRSLHRRGSIASLRSFDDDRSSRPSSMSSQADHRDRMAELDRDHYLEREREWNKRHPPPRPSSSLSSHSNHSHTHPSRPPSATAYSTPTLASLQRQGYGSRPSGASSPASSQASHNSLRDQDEEEEREVTRELTHERERNWNSPQPNWKTARHSHGASSLASHDSLRNQDEEEEREVTRELTHERGQSWNSPQPNWNTARHSRGSSGNEVTSASVHLSQSKSGRSLRASSSLPHLTPDARSKGSSTIVKSHSHKDKLDSVLDGSTSVHPPQHATQSSPPQTNQGEASPYTTPLKLAPASRFGWRFPRSHQLPPLDLEISPERLEHRNKESDSSHNRMQTSTSPSLTPTSRPSSRASNRSSLIPVPSTSKRNGLFSSGNFASSTPKADEEKFKKGHRKRLTEFTESVGSIHPQTNMHGAFGDEDMVLASDEESVSDFAPQSTTPRTRPSNSFPDDAPSETETEVLVSPPPSPPRQRSPVQAPPGVHVNDEARLHRALSSTSATSFRPPTPDYPLTTSRLQEQTTPSSFTPPGTPPLASIAPQDESSEVIPNFVLTTPPRRLSSSTSILDFRTPSPPHDLANLSALPSSSEDEVETREADVTPVRVDEGGLSNPNYTAMKTPRPPAPEGNTSPPPTSSELNMTAPSSPTSLSRANSEPERSSKTEAPAGNGLLTPIPSLSRANSLPLRTPAPPGAWMSTPNQPTMQNGQNGSTDQSPFGSIGKRRSILKVRFDVTESEASTAEVEHQRSPLPSGRVSAPDFLPDIPARRAESVLSKATNGFAQIDVVHDPVLARPRTPERPTTPVSRPNAPSPRSLRKSPTVKVVDAFGRERIDDLPTSADPQDIVNGRADANDAIRSSKSAEAPHTPRAQHKSNIRIVDAMGREIEEEANPVIEPLFEEEESVLHDDSPIGRTETLAQMRQTLREWADGLSDGDRSADDLALNTTHLEELEEVSKAARRARNQLAQTLRVESVKERDLMHKYAKDAVGRSGLLPAIAGDNSSFQRGLVVLGIVVQIIFVLAMWRFAHAQARRLFYTVYYDHLYPELNPLPGHSHQFSPPYPSFPWSLSSAYEIVKYEGWTALKAELQGTVRRIGEHAWERWGERPYTGTWPPT